MKIVKLISNGPCCIFISFVFLGGSCSPEPIDLNATDTADVANETATESYFSETEDISSVTVSADNATNGGRVAAGSRIINVNDPRLACATVTLTPAGNSTVLVPKGILNIDFGSGCTDNQGNVRKGIITVTYNGRRFLPGSSVVTTLTGYQINGITIDGVRSVTNSASSTQADPRFTTAMTGGTITWPDGTSATRDESITREWKLAAATVDNRWFVTGNATGKNRKALAYSMNITTSLVFKNKCQVNDQISMAVQGIKELVVSGKKITIDYGDGSCDKLVTVTIKSKSKIIDLGNN